MGTLRQVGKRFRHNFQRSRWGQVYGLWFSLLLWCLPVEELVQGRR